MPAETPDGPKDWTSIPVERSVAERVRRTALTRAAELGRYTSQSDVIAEALDAFERERTQQPPPETPNP